MRLHDQRAVADTEVRTGAEDLQRDDAVDLGESLEREVRVDGLRDRGHDAAESAGPVDSRAPAAECLREDDRRRAELDVATTQHRLSREVRQLPCAARAEAEELGCQRCEWRQKRTTWYGIQWL